MMQGLAILGFDADYGLEYINYQVATSLEDMRIEFATSCQGHSNDIDLAGPRTCFWGVMRHLALGARARGY